MTIINPDTWLSVWRALLGRCPNCGKGPLFTRYLKQVEHCVACNERFGHVRADDGPPWLTILVVGHIIGPIMLATMPNNWPDSVSMTVWPGLAIILTLVLLPRAKGLFIAMIWHMKCTGSEK